MDFERSQLLLRTILSILTTTLFICLGESLPILKYSIRLTAVALTFPIKETPVVGLTMGT